MTLGDNLKFIEEEAFSGCSSLSTIIIPANVESISINTFASCSSLKNVIISDITTWYITSDFNNWRDKINGIQFDASDADENASFLTEFCLDYYWYKI